MRRSSFALLALALALALASFAGPARAQYMYLDSNGDGVHTAADLLGVNGTPTTVDVWIRTDVNRDGSPGVCPTADGPLTINSYVLNMAASGGTVAYSNFVNRRLEAGTILQPFNSNATEMTVGWGGGTINPPGDYLLGTVTVTGVSGSPSVAIVPITSLQVVDVTNFGSQCTGNDFDNTLKLGSDWFDVDGLGGTAPANQPPVITAPALVSGSENSAIAISASAVDPDANLVTLSQTNNAPFLPPSSSAGPALNPAITLTGTPTFSQAGSYSIAWTAVDDGTPNLASSATTSLTIGGPHRNPVITAPATVSGTEGMPVSITASAASPDGVNVTLCVGALPGFLLGGGCAPPSPNPSLTISGTPGSNAAGSYTIQWTATDALGGAAAATTLLTIADSNRLPVLDQPFDMTLNEGETATQQLSATDPDNDPLTFFKVGASPVFMTVSASGLVSLAPGYADAGSYTATVRASDGATYDQKSFAVSVANVNRCPTASAGGPYSGVLFAAVSFDGTASSDPDGDALAYAWDFGDGATGAGATTSHTYVARATYTVTLSVDDGVCSAAATTTATIADGFTATAFTTGGNKTTSLGSGKPFTCVEVEPVAGSFDIANVNLASVRMVSLGTGSVSEIAADPGKTGIAGDKNGNGVTEIQACFAKEDLRLLFGALPAGRNDVDVTITGSLATGGSFLASLTLTVKSTGGALAAAVSPNPLNPSARLTFSTTKAGAIKVALYDLNGRLVRTYLGESTAAGTHDVTIDGRAASGARLASGVYFVKVETEFDGTETKRLTILK